MGYTYYYMTTYLESDGGSQDLAQNISTLIDFLLAIAGPFLLIIVGMVFPIHFVMEEFWKGAVVLKMKRDRESRMSAIDALSIGLLFGFSELVLFVMNALTSQNAEMLINRFLFTVPMHGFTATIMFAAARRGKWGWVVGLILAVVVHGTFNRLVK